MLQETRETEEAPAAGAPGATAETARMAVLLAVRAFGINAAHVEQAKRERDLLLDVFGRPTEAQRGDALVRAIRAGNDRAVARLLTAGVDPNSAGSQALGVSFWGQEGETAITAAIYGGSAGILRQLLEANADVERPIGRAVARSDRTRRRFGDTTHE